jgi:hypothetical protein
MATDEEIKVAVNAAFAGSRPVGCGDGGTFVTPPLTPERIIAAIEAVGQMRAQSEPVSDAAREMLAALELFIRDLEYYIGNPSAWENYSDDVSELMRGVHTLALPAIAKAKEPHV